MAAKETHYSSGPVLDEIEKQLDKTFKRSCMADDDSETPLAREVFALEDAVRAMPDL